MLKNFIEDNKLKQWPSKSSDRQEALAFLASYIPANKKYSENEMNNLLNKLHLFNDATFLRRELCDRRLISRDKYGREYWKTNLVRSLSELNL